MGPRQGKLHGQTKILLPWYDTEGMRHLAMIKLNGTIYASKMYAGIRQYCKDNFNVDVDKDWLHSVPMIVNEFDPELQISEDEKNKLVEDFISAMELKDDPIEDSPDSGSEAEAPPETGEPLCTVPDQPQ